MNIILVSSFYQHCLLSNLSYTFSEALIPCIKAFSSKAGWSNYRMANKASCQVRGSSINDVTTLGGEGQGFCDDSSKGLSNKTRDVIYGRPLR